MASYVAHRAVQASHESRPLAQRGKPIVYIIDAACSALLDVAAHDELQDLLERAHVEHAHSVHHDTKGWA